MSAPPHAPAPGAPPALQFADSTACAQWVDKLPLTNVQPTQRALTGQCAALAASAVPALERLKILETLKTPLTFLQSECGNRYLGKPLPFEPGETAMWTNVMELWRELDRNYQQCLQACREGDPAIAPHAALITMRCMECVSRQLLEHYRIYRHPPGALWHALHELYSFAEGQGLAGARVADCFAQQEPESSCRETYVQALLTHLANPYSLSARQMAHVRAWAEKWAPLVGLASQPVPDGPIPSLAVDLDGSDGVAFAADLASRSNLRYLELEQLSQTLRQAITLLKQGQTPAQLGLGETARQPGCENLLMLLYVQWCRAGTGRSEDRQEAEEPINVCFGVAAAHYLISGGREFRQPGEITSRERRELESFGHVARVQKTARGEAEAGLEKWQMVNHSAAGFMCILRNPGGAARVGHNQLVAVRRGESDAFQLGMVQWLRLEDSNELCCGVRLFPGIPQAVAVRAANFDPGTKRYARGLLLPEDASCATPATLILPATWFESGRLVEVVAERKTTATLLNLLEASGTFERCTVTLA